VKTTIKGQSSSERKESPMENCAFSGKEGVNLTKKRSSPEDGKGKKDPILPSISNQAEKKFRLLARKRKKEVDNDVIRGVGKRDQGLPSN